MSQTRGGTAPLATNPCKEIRWGGYQQILRKLSVDLTVMYVHPTSSVADFHRLLRQPLSAMGLAEPAAQGLTLMLVQCD
jgi:hypothetical protein